MTAAGAQTVRYADRDICIESALWQRLWDINRLVSKMPGAEKMVLYGSYAKGTNNDESDVDLAVFFGGRERKLLEEYRELVRICLTPETDIQVQAFCSAELDDPCGIVEEIVEYGIELPLLAE